MSETNNFNQSGNSNSDIQSVNKTEINNYTNSDSKLENISSLAPKPGDYLENQSSTILEPKDNSQETEKPKNIDWHKLAHKLREHNRKLLKQVFQLEQEIAETNNRIKEHKVRSQSTDMLIAQQAEEINHNQEEIAHVMQKLETSQQEVHSQQVMVNSLTKQLDTANEKFAQIERECSLLQEKYNQQTHDLLMKNQQIQELSARLSRQQRYTLKYKAALDEYLDVASSGNRSKTKFDSDLLQTHTQPVQAWSSVTQTDPAGLADELIAGSQIQTTKETVKLKSSSYRDLDNPEAESTPNSQKFQPTNWPSPLITSVNNQNKPHPLAAIKLPKFQHLETESS